MKSLLTYLIFLFLATTTACEKTDPTLLSGDIAGMVKVYDENNYLQEEMTGVQVSLSDGSFLSETTSDPSGKFFFQNIYFMGITRPISKWMDI